MASLLSGEYERDEVPGAKPRQTDDGAAAVIAIRPLCIKHTFVERREKSKRGRWRKGAG